ncbi:MAG: hypothetical protein QOG63_911 [Thermoleophilaceae bacterium]|jgi:hypothetical protein|nr:hypothetical protein [Thermoleophilaceae bacterium]
MLAKVRDRLTYANVVSTLCLFILLGGSAVAALKLPRHSVGARELRADAVSSPKVRDGSLEAQDFAPGQIPQGAQGPKGDPGQDGTPDSPDQILAKLTQIDGAGSTLDADRLDGFTSSEFVLRRRDGWTDATLPFPWGPYGVPYATPGYFRDQIGVVRLRGVVKNQTTGSVSASACTDHGAARFFTLPAADRPAADAIFVVDANGGFGRVVVRADGLVCMLQDVGPDAYTSLDGISFSAVDG